MTPSTPLSGACRVPSMVPTCGSSQNIPQGQQEGRVQCIPLKTRVPSVQGRVWCVPPNTRVLPSAFHLRPEFHWCSRKDQRQELPGMNSGHPLPADSIQGPLGCRLGTCTLTSYQCQDKYKVQREAAFCLLKIRSSLFPFPYRRSFFLSFFNVCKPV